jgi:hypothetical protein
MRAWSTIVASGPCLIGNLSAERGSGCCPIDNIFPRGRPHDKRVPNTPPVLPNIGPLAWLQPAQSLHAQIECPIKTP